MAVGELQKAVIENPAEYARRGEGQNVFMSFPTTNVLFRHSEGKQGKEAKGALKKPALGSGP